MVAGSAVSVAQTGSGKSNAGYKKIDGVEFKVINPGKGKKPVDGDYVDVNIKFKITDYKTRDTLIADSYKLNAGKPVTLPIKVGKKFEWTSIFTQLSKGDSAIARIPVDSLMKEYPNQLPPFMRAGDYAVYEVKLVDVKTAAEVQAESKKKSSKQNETDDALIQQYMKTNNIKASKTASGLYYVITKEGIGDKVAKGETAKVNYTGKLLDGTVFDSNTQTEFGHTEPIGVKVGTGMVIPGWDEGLALLKRNSVATFLIPSSLAYGARAQGKIPANAVLVFDVEIVDVTSGN